jgi:hypothetical protein
MNMWRATKGLAAILGLWLWLGTASEAQAVKRLILTDGSYQVVTEWQKNGERVRYLSAERGEWEEVPDALVDWKATNEWNAESAKQAESAAQEMKQVSAEEVAARKEEMLNDPLVAPGLKLPPEGGVFLFEETGAKPLLMKIEPNKIEVDENLGKTILKRSVIPVASQTQIIELKGAEAKVRVRNPAPSIFVDVENDGGVIPADNFRIIRMERKRDKRVLGKNTVHVTGEEELKQHFLRSRAEKFSGEWWKVIPLEDLAPGEYAIVVYAKGAEQDNVVWDFGVDK